MPRLTSADVAEPQLAAEPGRMRKPLLYPLSYEGRELAVDGTSGNRLPAHSQDSGPD
jgi:hypothetical protein